MAIDLGTAVGETSVDPKRARILQGALGVFLAYGYSRTTMDDIAKAAELSRPALYLLFRNKTDIYRAIARSLLGQCQVQSAEALKGEGTLLERIDAMLLSLFEMMKPIEKSPHGTEILDMKNSLAGDVIAEWRATLEDALAAEIASEATRNGVDLAERHLTPNAVARTFFDALDGMKPRMDDPACHLEAARTTARLVVLALRP